MSSSLDVSFQSFEKLLNGFGHIPIISSISAPFRHLLGEGQFWGGIVVGIISAPFNWKQSEHGLEVALHGVANMFRSGIEEVPFINMITIPYDVSDRFEYASLKVRHVVLLAI